MKRTIILLLTVLMLSFAAACESAGTAPAASPSLSPVPTAAPTPETMPLEEQRELIMDNYELWKFQAPYYSPWFYTITDLDHNGRLEVIAASVQGTGIFTTAFFWEVNADGTGLVPCETGLEEGMACTDIIQEETPCYYDAATGRYYYVYEDLTRNGAAEHYYSLSALCLYNGKLEMTPLCSYSEIYSDPDTLPVLSYSAADGTAISEQEYRDYADRHFAGLEKSSLNTQWTKVEEPLPSEPMPEAAVSGGPQVVISKNPSSEALTVGGKTWFIAHADNADSLTWQLLSPDGTVYSLADAMTANPGLSLEALEGDTLAVGNVPLSLNGWGVQARFEGQGSYAETEPAYIYVGDFLSAYSSVIEKYRAAKEAGISTIADCYNYDVSEMTASGGSVGYAMKDLDKDGVPELIIAGIGTDAFSDKGVYDIYTLTDGQPKQLAVAGARSRLYLTTANRIFNAGSSGAANSIYYIYRLEGGELVLEEGVLSAPDENSGGIAWYYTTDTDYDVSNDTPISDGEAQERIAAYEGSVYLPQLTKIA